MSIVSNCGKVPYPDKKSAQEAVDQFAKQASYFDKKCKIRFYQCSICQGLVWHFGRSDGIGISNGKSGRRGRRL